MSKAIRILQIARSARRELGLSDDIPIHAIFRVLDRKGLRVIRYPFGFRKISSLLARYRDEYFIVVDSTRTLGHQVFSVAHEYGHYVEHRDRLTFVCEPTYPDAGALDMERWANRFAAEFLMPRAAVERWLMEQDLEAASLTLPDAVRLQQAMGVSYEAMLNRLVELELISSEQRVAWGQESPVRVARKLGVPVDLYQPDEVIQVPEEYQALWVQAYENGRVSFRRLQAALARIGVDAKHLDLSHPAGIDDVT